MVVRSEVIATIPFAKKRGLPYVCYTTTDGGRVVVAENGVQKFKTGVKAEPGSNYVLEGKKVVRYWDPDEDRVQRDAAAARTARAEIVRSSAFASVARATAKRLSGTPKLEIWDEGSDEEIPVWVIRNMKKRSSLDELRKELKSSSATVVGCEEDIVKAKVTALAILPGLDPIEGCDWLSGHIPVADLKSFLRDLDNDCGVDLQLVSRDCVRFSLRGKVKKATQHVKALVDLELDEPVSKSVAAAMIKDGSFFFWWD